MMGQVQDRKEFLIDYTNFQKNLGKVFCIYLKKLIYFLLVVPTSVVPDTAPLDQI